MTEDVERYIARKRQDTCFGNYIEIIAIAEIYNRPIEVYEYSSEPKNTFQSVFQTDNEPIRLSYHGRNHYNSVVNPYKATIGVGLGLPQLIPGVSYYLHVFVFFPGCTKFSMVEICILVITLKKVA